MNMLAGLDQDFGPGLNRPPRRWTELAATRLAGLPITTASRADLVAAMIADCRIARPAWAPKRARLVFDANGQGLSLYARNADYRAAMDRADVVHADGGFIVTLSRWLGTGGRIAERSATTDLIHDFAAAAADNGLSFYLLGGPEAVNRRCAETLAARYPGLAIVGRHHGFFTDAAPVVDDIAALAPDILWVGLGKPQEQGFAVEIAGRANAAWILTCGGCFNFVSGDYRRAPLWMQRANIEWLYRLASSPRRLFWRYAVTNPHALWLVFADVVRRRGERKAGSEAALAVEPIFPG